MAKQKLEKPLYDKTNLTLIWEEAEETDKTALVEKIEPSEVSTFSQAAHRRDTEGYDLSQNAMCFEVIGGIVLAIGILFIFLSLKKSRNQIVGVDFASLQFVICAVCLIGGIVALTIGTIWLVKALKKRRNAKRDIAFLGTLSRK